MAYPDPIADNIGLMTAGGRSDANVRFDRTEWKVIMLARRDGLKSLQPPSHIANFLHWAFGGGLNRHLANPRLETLRRLAVHAWRMGYSVPKAIVEGTIEAGFSAAQVEALLALITANICKSKLLNARCSAEVDCPKPQARLMQRREASTTLADF